MTHGYSGELWVRELERNLDDGALGYVPGFQQEATSVAGTQGNRQAGSRARHCSVGS